MAETPDGAIKAWYADPSQKQWLREQIRAKQPMQKGAWYIKIGEENKIKIQFREKKKCHSSMEAAFKAHGDDYRTRVLVCLYSTNEPLVFDLNLLAYNVPWV
jgi:hypothetical protein